jgi:hypothetical protein
MYTTKTKNNIRIVSKEDYDMPMFEEIVGDVSIINYTFVSESEITIFTRDALEILPLTKTVYINYCEEALHSTYWNIIFDLCKDKGYKRIVWTDGGLTKGHLLRHLDNVDILHKTSCFAFNRLEYNYKSIIGKGLNPKTTHFVSLARMPRSERIYFTGKLLEKKIQDKGIVSCGWGDKDFFNSNGPYSHNNKELIEEFLVKSEFINKFPVDLGDDDDQQWDNLHNFEDAVFNIVMESSTGYNETCAEAVYQNKSYGWCRVNTDRYFLTEKTTKSFYCRQLPLFVAPAGYVEHLRKLGFDVFDDILNHNYDKEDNIFSRCDMIISHLEELIVTPVDEWNNILKHLKPRFDRNIELCRKLGDSNREIEWINSLII